MQIIFDRPVPGSGLASLLPEPYDLLPHNKCIIRSMFVCVACEVFYFRAVALKLFDLRTHTLLRV